MLDFLGKNYFLFIYGITWFIAVFNYKKYFESPLKYFPIIISYTFFNELLGVLIRNYEQFQLVYSGTKDYNHILYNIYHVVFFSYFLHVYYVITQTRTWKKTIQFLAVVYFLVLIVNVLIQNPMVRSLLYAYLAGALFMCVLAIQHLLKHQKEYSWSASKYSLMWWVSLGLLFFFLPYIPIKIVKEFNLNAYRPLQPLHLAIIFFQYVLFSAGFIISRTRVFR